VLRIHFTDADLVRTRMAPGPDPLWEIASSLHRFQTRQGRWAYASWYRDALGQLDKLHLIRTVRSLLLPLFPRAIYFPDFLTPAESTDGLEAGLQAILAAPRERVSQEIELLARTGKAHVSLSQVAERQTRRELVRALRAYHDAVIHPYAELIQIRIDAERSLRARTVLGAGATGVLSSLGPWIRWHKPVLEVHHPEDRDLHLNGRGLVLVPSFFCWHTPVTLADPVLPQVLVYPLHHRHPDDAPTAVCGQPALAALLGATRAALLAACALGATSSELARAVGVSPGTVSFHTRALREAQLLFSQRYCSTILHTLTPLGASLLRANRGQTHNAAATG
jgi:DNA-binding transcriptional ArsR family regulator